MLGLFRKRAKIILWFIIFGVGIPFILWGTGAGRSGLASRRYVGEIYGRKVSTAEFFQVRKFLGILALLRGERPDEQSIDTAVWNRIMLIEEAERMGLTVFPGEIAAAIGRIPAFMPGGRFSPETFNWYMQNWRITPSDFELMVADSIRISKLQGTMMSTVLISDAEVRDIYENVNERVSIRYALFPSVVWENGAELGEEELLAYYAENGGEFRVPEKMTVTYATIEAAKPEKGRPATAHEIEEYYRGNPDLFRHGRRTRLRQIVVRSRPGADEKEIERVESNLRAIQARLEKEKDFAKLARKYSDDDATASSGGDLGFVEEGMLPKELSDRAFSLAAGEIAGPVLTGNGHYFIKAEEIQEAGVKELAEVSTEIAGIIEKESGLRASEEGDERASERALSVAMKLIDTPDLGAVAGAESLPVKTAGPLSREEAAGTLPRELAEAAFGMDVGEISDPIPLPGTGYVICTVDSREDERTPPLSEVRERVVESYRAGLGRKTAKEDAEKALGDIEQRMEKEGADFQSACRELGIETRTSPPLPLGAAIPDLGLSMGVDVPAYSLATGEPGPVIETGEGFLLFAPVERLGADLKPLEEKTDLFRQQYLARKRQMAWLEWFKKAQARAGAIDSSFLEEE